MSKMQSVIETVTARVIERSKPGRAAYLDLIARQRDAGVNRPTLSCGNLAHGFAASGDDKAAIRGGKLPTLSEFEDFLREAGFSKSQSKAVAGHGLRKLLDQCEADGKNDGALQMLKDFKLPSF